MILLLNKIDVFKRKILLSPVSLYFGDYTGKRLIIEKGLG
jgi:hypothetical protein